MQETTVVAKNRRVLLGRVRDRKDGMLKMVPYFRKGNENVVINNVRSSGKTEVGDLISFAIDRDDGDHSSYDVREPIKTSHYDIYKGNSHGVISIGRLSPDPRGYMDKGFFQENDNGAMYFLTFSNQMNAHELMAQSAEENTPLVCYHENGEILRLEMAY